MSTPASTASAITDEQIRAAFLANGFTIKEGHDDLKPYVYAAARAVLALAAPTTQPKPPSKWIDDPHDIEQGQMLNPEWLAFYGKTAQQVHAEQQTPQTFAPTAQPAGEVFESLRDMANAVYERAAVEPSQPGADPNTESCIYAGRADMPHESYEIARIGFLKGAEWAASRTPAPAAPEDAKDAARYRWLNDQGCIFYGDDGVRHQVCEWAMNEAIDAAIASSTNK